MYKIIDCSSFFKEDEITVTLLDLKGVSGGGLVKAAADDRVKDYVKTLLKPQEGKFYLHINAMGAGEYYGANRNADYFPEEQLKQFHKTFEESGHVFRHHVNKDPAKSMGKVIYSIYNERMHRVELVAEVDRVLGADIYDRIQRGDFPQTSMACKTPWDVCSICGNKAHTRQEYCIHLTSQLNKQMPDGRKVMAMNVAPLRFFDISIVIKPADVTSSVLQKVANYGPAVSSALLAEEEGFFETLEKKADRIKQATLRKLSELTKKIEGGQVLTAGKSFEEIAKRLVEPKDDLLSILSKVPLEESLNALAELGISPSIAFLATLIARQKGFNADAHFGKVVEDFVLSVDPSKLPPEAIELLGDIEEKDASPHLVKAVASRSDASLFQDHVEKRAGVLSAIITPQVDHTDPAFYGRSQVHGGYLDTSKALPEYVHAPKEQRSLWQRELEGVPEKERESVLKHLLTVGAAAMIAKMTLSSLLDEKIIKMQKLKDRADLRERELKYRGTTGRPNLDDSVLYSYYRKREG